LRSKPEPVRRLAVSTTAHAFRTLTPAVCILQALIE
jgi:hypothetical protein